jgi:Spy/CpxP family protein refolding chaperone
VTGRLGLYVVFSASVAAAQPAAVPGSVWRWWSNPEIVADVGLTARQTARIEEAQAASRAQRAETGRLLRARRMRLGELIGRKTVDRAEIARVLGEISRLQRDQLRSVVHLRLRVRRILTAEQLARLLERHPTLMERPWESPRRGGPSGVRR